MATASRSLATALWGARFASAWLPHRYTTQWDMTSFGVEFMNLDVGNHEVSK